MHDRFLHNRGDLQLLFRRHLGLRSGFKIAVVKLGASLLVVGGCSPTGAVLLGRASECCRRSGSAGASSRLPACLSRYGGPAAKPQRASLQLSRFAVPWTWPTDWAGQVLSPQIWHLTAPNCGPSSLPADRDEHWAHPTVAHPPPSVRAPGH